MKLIATLGSRDSLSGESPYTLTSLQFALDEAVVPGVVEVAVMPILLLPNSPVAITVGERETLLMVSNGVDKVLDSADGDKVTLPEIAVPVVLGSGDVDNEIEEVFVEDGMKPLDEMPEGVIGVAPLTPYSSRARAIRAMATSALAVSHAELFVSAEQPYVVFASSEREVK